MQSRFIAVSQQLVASMRCIRPSEADACSGLFTHHMNCLRPEHCLVLLFNIFVLDCSHNPLVIYLIWKVEYIYLGNPNMSFILTKANKICYKTSVSTQAILHLYDTFPTLGERWSQTLEGFCLFFSKGEDNHALDYVTFHSSLAFHWPTKKSSTTARKKKKVKQYFKNFANLLAD